MRVAQIQDNFDISIAEQPIPAIPPRGALVKVIGCGLCGSDLDKFIHRKAAPGSVLGHEVVGVIESLAEGHPEGWQVDDRMVTAHHVPCQACHYCLNDSESMCRQFKNTNLNPGGFAQHFALTEGHLRHTAFKVPADIDADEASCVEPLACVLRGIRRVGHSIQGSVMIIGLGFIGMMAAQVYKNQGYAVYGVDLDASRLDLAKAQGFVTDAFHPAEETARMQDVIQQQLPLGKVDTVFLSAVNPKTIALAQDCVRDGGNLLVFTSAPEGASIDPSRLYFREINLITTYSPALQDLQAAAQMIFERKINVKPLISHHMPLSEIEQAIALYRSGEAIKVFIETDGDTMKPGADYASIQTRSHA